MLALNLSDEELFRFNIDKNMIKRHHSILGIERRQSRSIRQGSDECDDYTDSMQERTEHVTSNDIASNCFVDEFRGNETAFHLLKE